MNIDLSPIDRRKVKNLGEVLEMNNEVLGLMSRYLTVCPDFITKELIEGITGECEITLAEAYTSLLVAACGLDVENNPRDRYLSTAYLRSGIRRLDPQEYRMNPYYRQIRIPEAHFGNWKLTIEKYKPYEAFVCDDIRTDEELKEIPQIGFFDTEFSFPAVMEDGQVFYADYAKPEGFCDEAWKAIYQYVFALSHGAGKTLFYYGDWIRKPGVAICSCNDGLRPVIFKLEATEEESVIDYTPVR